MAEMAADARANPNFHGFLAFWLVAFLPQSQIRASGTTLPISGNQVRLFDGRGGFPKIFGKPPPQSAFPNYFGKALSGESQLS